MGKQARAITEINLKDLARDLNKAYADEWLAFYLYWYMASTVSGRAYKDVKEMLQELAKDELEHAGELADLIIKLGDAPLADPMDLEKNANAPYFMPPKNTADINRIMRIVAEAEAGTIEVYSKLAKKTFGKEYVIHQVLTHILSEEVTHEEMFENLLER
ncbi:MAG: bacterioferritin [Candidatus Omnitrophica bacterium CG08_land_8_20_14_0_20_41_16]|uniref:Bacterioferritin n=1 Tax=Candidatus Sherwoodlollariibacterium unditelluris TaxID=1974757 RepID=A0A2G9YJA0_9BACT|nr:MAG: bacterioferritin [Candidatus Omnitrophica bacterium CG23_combo_of_CG06-09_8_20_14_all_41_10]PIS34430.1 MAG: bacterioferritin [Candidatus Omnitrophica bacterium CG08_land_8_20_14_0_20_41_16]